MRLMRHADMRVTLNHYTDLRLNDQAKAIATLPRIGEPAPSEREAQRATGTTGDSAPALEAMPAVVTHLVALRAPEGAFGCAAVHNPTGPESPLRLSGATGDGAQTRYTSRPGTGVHRGAGEAATDVGKSRNRRNLRAIGAAG